MQTLASVEIDRPIAEVFDCANNHVTDWSITVVGDEILEVQPGHVGTKFLIITEERGKKMEFESERQGRMPGKHSIGGPLVAIVHANPAILVDACQCGIQVKWGGIIL